MPETTSGDSSRHATLPIAERVRQARVAVRLTQQQLGGDSFSKSYISAVERGKMTPSIQALAQLSERLGVPMSFLLGESAVDLEQLAARQAEQPTSSTEAGE